MIASRLDHTMPTIAEDLALDEALLIEVDEARGPTALRFWEPRELAVVLGASGKLSEDVHRDQVDVDGVTLARRSSGGGTVIIGPGVLNVTVILANDAAPGLDGIVSAQAYVLERLAEAMRSLGSPVTVKGSGDLTIEGRKFAGSAQRRLRNHFFVHVSILNTFDLSLIPRYLAEPQRRPDYRESRPHEHFLTRLNLNIDLLKSAIARSWFPEKTMIPTTPLPLQLVRALMEERFGEQSWVERF